MKKNCNNTGKAILGQCLYILFLKSVFKNLKECIYIQFNVKMTYNIKNAKDSIKDGKINSIIGSFSLDQKLKNLCLRFHQDRDL
jgi:hypothetical protein